MLNRNSSLSDLQALKSGQLPADLQILDDKTGANTAKGEDEETVPSNQNELDIKWKNPKEQQQKGDELAPDGTGMRNVMC